MDSGELLELFYNRTYEKFVNKQILDDKNYIVPRQQLTNYVRELIDIPYIEFIEYLKNRNEKIIVDSTDITHFSSFSACEIGMCNALIWANNPGCTFVEIGRLFPDSVPSRNEGAYRWFGENHIKAATQLGLTFEYYDYWYLSCIGYVYPDLDHDERLQLLARTITRNRLYHKMLIDIVDHDVYPELYLTMFSGSTLKSRIINVVTFFDICIEECTLNNVSIHRLYRRNANIDSSSSLSSGKERSIYRLYRSYELLSTDDIISFFQRYKRGDLNAFDTLVKSYLRLVLSIAKLFEGKGLEYDDLIQEGTLGLIKAIEKYDYTLGFSFGFYAKTWIKQYIINAINTQSLTVKIPQNQLTLYNKIRKEIEKLEQKNGYNPSIAEIEIEEDVELENLIYLSSLPDDLHELVSRKEDLDDFPSIEFSADDIVMKESKFHIANSLLRKLKPRDAKILRSVFGIGVKEETLEEIGDRMCLTRERVRQIKESAIRKLREIVNKSNCIEQTDIEDEESKEEGQSLEETEKKNNVQKIQNRAGRNKRKSSNNRQIQTYRIVNKDETFEIRGANNNLLFISKGYIKSINGNLYCFRLHFSYLNIYLIKVSGYEFKVGELIIHASKSSHLYQVLIGNKYDKIKDIKQDYSNKEYKVHADDNWYNYSGFLIMEGAEKTHKECVPKLYSDKEVSVGDRILYKSKPCVVLEIIIKYNVTRLKIEYDDGRMDNVPGDLNSVEILKHQKDNCNKKLSTSTTQKKGIENVVVPSDKKEKTSKIKSREELYPQFSVSTSLSDLVGLGVITKTQLKHCHKKGLWTIGDVKNKIENYHLTPDSTRFTKYTLDMWFGIIGLLNNK